MKASEQWLREWVPTDASVETLCDALTMAGLEVDDLHDEAPDLAGVVVGRIVDCAPHPQADRLKLCRVDVGEPQPLAIICGAPNAEKGLVAPVARVGATLPNGIVIEATTIRGEPSNGMLCSASELGFAAAADGLWALAGAPVGASLAQALGLPDRVLEIDLTPNRGDCLSIRGVAREIAVVTGCEQRPPTVDSPAEGTPLRRGVHIDAPERCAGYAARSLEDTRASAATPVWMAERLRRAGVRRINLPVDIGNYVMLELGQPMHTFDGDRLAGDIRVRMAEDGERITTLDGEHVVLSAQTLVIADDEGPVAIAGIIGGQRTAVDDNTRHVVFESACFVPAAVAGQGRRYKLHTDALHRFERGVDPALRPLALDRAAALLLAYGAGRCGPATHVRGEPVWKNDRRIPLRADHVERLLGEPIESSWIETILPALGIELAPDGAGRWLATPPSWRYDLAIEVDLIEEIARVYGYDRLCAAHQGVSLPLVTADASVDEAGHADAVLRQRGYSEAITYSFVEPRLHAELTGGAAAIALDNPISDQLVEMRRTLWASLLPSWAHNVRRQQESVRLYERGLRFAPDTAADNGIAQRDTLAGLISGMAEDTHWDREHRPVDFFDIKGDVQALLVGSGSRVDFIADVHPALHPGRAARIVIDGESAGWLGQLSPAFSKRYKNKALPYLFEIDSKVVARKDRVRFHPMSEQPTVRRDLAVVVAEQTPVAALVNAIEALEAEEIQSIGVFDLFRGADLETGFKSVALGLIFQDKASTLTDERVDTIITRVVATLHERCGARIRGE
jgi:phenylalanyl-tRNA synthetase beta chain